MRSLRTLVLASSTIAAAAVACGGSAPPAPVPPPTTSTPPAESAAAPSGVKSQLAGIDAAALDRSVSPCDDFYGFACGGWVNAQKIPDDEASWMRSFSVIREKNELLLRDILESYARGEHAKEPYAKALGDFYSSCMDEAGVEKLGLQPIDKHLRAIDAIKDAKTLGDEVASLHVEGVPVLFALGAGQDFKDATRVIGQVEQAGLGMPDRDYYLKTDKKSEELRGAYLTFVKSVMSLLGRQKGAIDKSAASVMKIEKLLAQASMPREDRRDPHKVYHLTKREELAKLAPQFPWATYLPAVGAKDVAVYNVAQPEFVKATAKAVGGQVSLAEWKDYLAWHVVRAHANLLPKVVSDEALKWKTALVGTPKLPERWKRCVRATDGAMGEALGRTFVARTLGDAGKDRVRAMVVAIEAEMAKNLDGLVWMDDATRKAAHGKLSKIANKIAFPDKWRSFDGLVVERGKYLENASRAEAFEHKRQLAKVGKPIDRSEWLMSPPTVNAYYDPSMNEMVFPAGILQPPFYSNRTVMSVNYGSIGMVMGHELTHGFDDEGRQFDGDGNLKEWWTPKVAEEFKKRAECVKGQFDEYTVLDGVHVNGKLTLGENIADLGGIKLAHQALLALKMEKAKDAEFSPEQELFLGYAQGWCGKYRDEAMRLLVSTNPHSPPQLRVNGPLSNLPAFAKAFQCKEGSKMVRKNACTIW